MKWLLSMTRAHRVVTLSVAVTLLVALVGAGVWRQVSVHAAPTPTTFSVVSDLTDTWSDPTNTTSTTGTAVYTYGNFGCTGIDPTTGFCTGGAWTDVSIPGAHWIWETQNTEPSQTGPVTFTKTFTIPASSTALTGHLQMTADNVFDVKVNGTEVGTGNNHDQVYAFDIGTDLHTGQNTITTTVTNLCCFDPVGNPAGLYYGATISYVSDNTPPTTTKTVSGQTGSNGWYIGPVTLMLQATDPDDAASALTTSYSLDKGTTWQTYGAALTFGADGRYTVLYHSADPAGNVEADQTAAFNIDMTPPALNINGAPSGTFDICAGGVPSRPSFAPTDTTSGLDGTQGDSWTTPTTASGVGNYAYAAHATDLAGNSSQETRTYSVTYGSAYSTPSLPDSDDDGASGVIGVGHHIFVWFQLLCNGTPITNAGATLTITPGSDVAAGKAEADKGRKNRNTDVFQYVSEVQAYVLDVWTMQSFTNPDGSVVNFGAGTYTLTISLDDGSTYSHTVQLGSGGRTRWLDTN